MEITEEITCSVAKATIAVDDPNDNVNANNNMIDASFNELFDANQQLTRQCFIVPC